MALLSTFPVDGKAPFSFEWLRRMLQASGVQEGVFDSGDFKVTPAAAGGMRVDIAAGMALVEGNTGFRNALYLQINDAAVANAVTLDPSHATLPRIDRVIMRLGDSSDLATATDNPTFDKVTGVPTSGATLDNENGIGAMPNDAILLSTHLVPAASTATSTGNTRDRRRRARGAYVVAEHTANIVHAASGAGGGVISANLTKRLELSGNGRLRAQLSFEYDQPSGVQDLIFYLLANAVQVSSRRHGASASTDYSDSVDFGALALAGGSHQIVTNAQTAGAITTTFGAGANRPMQLILSEELRPSASND